MLTPCVALLALNLAAPAGEVEPVAYHAVAGFMQVTADGPLPHGPAWLPWLSLALAVVLATYDLSRAHLPERLVRTAVRARSGPFTLLERAHSGLIGDYVTWIVVGLALLAGRLMLA